MNFRIDKNHQLHVETLEEYGRIQDDILSREKTIELARFLYSTACLDIAEEMRPVNKADKKAFITKLVESMLEGK